MDNSMGDLFAKIGKFDFSKLANPESLLPKYDMPDIPSIDIEDSILGDIKRQLIDQNNLGNLQIQILLEQNKLLSDNYSKLKEMYYAQTESYASAKEDLKRSRNLNKWMTTVAIISMLAAIAGPIATVIVSR